MADWTGGSAPARPAPQQTEPEQPSVKRHMVAPRDTESSGHLMTATVLSVLALIFWFVAVERPKIESIGVMASRVREAHLAHTALEGRVSALSNKKGPGLTRGGGALDEDAVAALIQAFGKELEAKMAASKRLVEDIQTKQASDRRQLTDALATKTERIEALEAQVNRLERTMIEMQEDAVGAERLERAVKGLG
ncbi:hypothetical protein T484DRAFT_1876550, partial [Baffinella frigidus]